MWKLKTQREHYAPDCHCAAFADGCCDHGLRLRLPWLYAGPDLRAYRAGIAYAAACRRDLLQLIDCDGAGLPARLPAKPDGGLQ